MARIVLIGAQAPVRQELTRVLAQAGHVVCGEAAHPAEAQTLLAIAPAELLLLDLSPGEPGGLLLIADLACLGPAVLVYSPDEEAETIVRLFAAGAGGYVTTSEAAEILPAAVAECLAGRRYISPRTAQILAERVLAGPKSVPRG